MEGFITKGTKDTKAFICVAGDLVGRPYGLHFVELADEWRFDWRAAEASSM